MTKSRIYVTCFPTPFFRFAIERKSEDIGCTAIDRAAVRAGSGTLSKYWSMALAIADHCLGVGKAVRLGA